MPPACPSSVGGGRRTQGPQAGRKGPRTLPPGCCSPHPLQHPSRIPLRHSKAGGDPTAQGNPQKPPVPPTTPQLQRGSVQTGLSTDPVGRTRCWGCPKAEPLVGGMGSPLPRSIHGFIAHRPGDTEASVVLGTGAAVPACASTVTHGAMITLGGERGGSLGGAAGGQGSGCAGTGEIARPGGIWHRERTVPLVPLPQSTGEGAQCPLCTPGEPPLPRGHGHCPPSLAMLQLCLWVPHWGRDKGDMVGGLGGATLGLGSAPTPGVGSSSPGTSPRAQSHAEAGASKKTTFFIKTCTSTLSPRT